MYRIKKVTNGNTEYYIVQKRILFFFWDTCSELISIINGFFNTEILRFNTFKEAEEYINNKNNNYYKEEVVKIIK